jgi:lipopolysaccharide transport system ATP-binding protein
MTTPIITATNIGKKYNITHTRGGYIALRDVLMNVFKNPFSFLKGKAKEIIGRDTKEEFWALRGVNFEIQRGEVIGIIGRNGAGKSTLLKILSQITPPTTGEIKMHGTVGSLLEVGTGFHPELTGRENIFLNGAILGMKKKEIAKKFDEIVSFAGIEKFLDTPVKYYSSGMYVRLAFSVAAHMEPDILIIDEVLAVGDAEFQKKCLGKMEEITKKEGRTILFVSHNMVTVRELCTRSILLSKGQVVMSGPTGEVIDAHIKGTYTQEDNNTSERAIYTESITKKYGLHFTDISILNAERKNILRSSDSLTLQFSYESDETSDLINPRVVATITSKRSGNVVMRIDSDIPEHSLKSTIPPKGKITCNTQSPIHLSEGTYIVDIDFHIDGTSASYIKGALVFEVETVLSDHHYKKYPDVNVCDSIIEYTFTQDDHS